MAAPFGLCLTGRPIITEFEQIDANRFAIEVPDAESIHEMAFFLLPNANVVADYVFCLYASPAPFDDWIYVGGIMAEVPSVISLIRWSVPVSAGTPARFGVSVEPKSSSQAMMMTLKSSTSSFALDDAKIFARAIATDLFRFLDSFGHSVGSEAMSTLDKWFGKFSKKLEQDPDFWKKISNRD